MLEESIKKNVTLSQMWTHFLQELDIYMYIYIHVYIYIYMYIYIYIYMYIWVGGWVVAM